MASRVLNPLYNEMTWCQIRLVTEQCCGKKGDMLIIYHDTGLVLIVCKECVKKTEEAFDYHSIKPEVIPL